MIIKTGDIEVRKSGRRRKMLCGQGGTKDERVERLLAGRSTEVVLWESARLQGTRTK